MAQKKMPFPATIVAFAKSINHSIIHSFIHYINDDRSTSEIVDSAAPPTSYRLPYIRPYRAGSPLPCLLAAALPRRPGQAQLPSRHLAALPPSLPLQPACLPAKGPSLLARRFASRCFLRFLPLLSSLSLLSLLLHLPALNTPRRLIEIHHPAAGTTVPRYRIPGRGTYYTKFQFGCTGKRDSGLSPPLPLGAQGIARRMRGVRALGDLGLGLPRMGLAVSRAPARQEGEGGRARRREAARGGERRCWEWPRPDARRAPERRGSRCDVMRSLARSASFY